MKQPIQATLAPQAIGPYSQAIQSGNTVYLSGQIPLVPSTMELLTGDIAAQTQQVLHNMRAVCEAAGGRLEQIVKLTIFLMDLNDFAAVNAVLKTYFSEPYPARSTVQVAGLPKGAQVEIEAILVLA